MHLCCTTETGNINCNTRLRSFPRPVFGGSKTLERTQERPTLARAAFLIDEDAYREELRH